MLALRPFTRYKGTIAASDGNLSVMASKHANDGVQRRIPEDKQDPNEHEPRLKHPVETRPLPGSDKELQRLDDLWLKYSQELEKQQKKESQRKTGEIQKLTVGPPLIISILFLISL